MHRIYSVQLKKIRFDQALLQDFYSTTDHDLWLQRKDKLTNLWSIDENRSFDKEHPFYTGLIDSLSLPVKSTDAYFSKVHQGGLPNHFDFDSFSKIQFPVSGENLSIWKETELMFIDNFDHILERISHVTDQDKAVPILYNCNQMHATYRDIGCKAERVTFVVNCNLWFDKLNDFYKKGTLIKENQYFTIT